MNLQDFTKSVQQSAPPKGISAALQALWYDKKGNWNQAHDIAQDMLSDMGAWIHAYLHRKEGDIWNADYWYRNAGRKRPATSLEEEWAAIVTHCLMHQS